MDKNGSNKQEKVSPSKQVSSSIFGKPKKLSDGPREQILHWVHQFEKINSSIDESIPVTSIGGQDNQISTTTGCEVSNDELCFRATQMLTELLLMLFAACLLIIAMVVIFSKKIPAIMESYDIIPKFLFFLCIIVAVCSLIRWLMSKIARYTGAKKQEAKQVDSNGTTKSNVTATTTTTPARFHPEDPETGKTKPLLLNSSNVIAIEPDEDVTGNGESDQMIRSHPSSFHGKLVKVAERPLPGATSAPLATDVPVVIGNGCNGLPYNLVTTTSNGYKTNTNINQMMIVNDCQPKGDEHQQSSQLPARLQRHHSYNQSKRRHKRLESSRNKTINEESYSY